MVLHCGVCTTPLRLSWLTELRATGAGFPVTGSTRVTVTTQQPQPPSAHIRFVPVSPDWEYSHSCRVSRGLAPDKTTRAPLSVKDTCSTGAGGFEWLVPIIQLVGGRERSQSCCMGCVWVVAQTAAHTTRDLSRVMTSFGAIFKLWRRRRHVQYGLLFIALYCLLVLGVVCYL